MGVIDELVLIVEVVDVVGGTELVDITLDVGIEAVLADESALDEVKPVKVTIGVKLENELLELVTGGSDVSEGADDDPTPGYYKPKGKSFDLDQVCYEVIGNLTNVVPGNCLGAIFTVSSASARVDSSARARIHLAVICLNMVYVQMK